MSNINSTTSNAQTAAYLKRRAQRLIKKSQFVKSKESKTALINSAQRNFSRANELYNNC